MQDIAAGVLKRLYKVVVLYAYQKTINAFT
jgi:hypothetical protein